MLRLSRPLALLLSICLLWVSMLSLLTLSRCRTAVASQSIQDRTLPTVVIDAGHGGEDGGAVGVNGIYEKELNLRIALLLADMLRAAGVPVKLTRTRDELLYDKGSDYEGKKKVQDLEARLSAVNACTDPVLVSIHMNTFPVEKYHGLQVYYSANSEESAVMAETVQSKVKSMLQPDNRRQSKQATGSIGLLKRVDCPAVLIECGFLSNAEECYHLCEESYQKELSFSLYCAIFSYLSEKLENAS